MAASLKVSELTALTSLDSADLLLVTDSSATESKKATFSGLQSSMSLANLGTKNLSDLTDIASLNPSNGHVLTYSTSSSSWTSSAPADPAQLATLTTLTGVAEGTAHFGTFSGALLGDNLTLKTILQH